MRSWQMIRVFGGFMVLLTLGLGVEGSPIFHSSNWLWFTAFVGLNLMQSGLTSWCPAEIILRKLGIQGGDAAACSRPVENKV